MPFQRRKEFVNNVDKAAHLAEALRNVYEPFGLCDLRNAICDISTGTALSNVPITAKLLPLNLKGNPSFNDILDLIQLIENDSEPFLSGAAKMAAIQAYN